MDNDVDNDVELWLVLTGVEFEKDEFPDPDPPRKSVVKVNKKRKSGRQYRRDQKSRKFARDARIVDYSKYPCDMWFGYPYRGDERVEDRTHIRRPKDSKNEKYWKRHAAKAVRRQGPVSRQKGAYKRCFDYWWTID